MIFLLSKHLYSGNWSLLQTLNILLLPRVLHKEIWGIYCVSELSLLCIFVPGSQTVFTQPWSKVWAGPNPTFFSCLFDFPNSYYVIMEIILSIISEKIYHAVLNTVQIYILLLQIWKWVMFNSSLWVVWQSSLKYANQAGK